jgi:hypothetical protein
MSEDMIFDDHGQKRKNFSDSVNHFAQRLEPDRDATGALRFTRLGSDNQEIRWIYYGRHSFHSFISAGG